MPSPPLHDPIADPHADARLNPKSSVQAAIGVNRPRVVQRSQEFTGGSFNTRDFFDGAGAPTLRWMRRAFLLCARMIRALEPKGWQRRSSWTWVAGLAVFAGALLVLDPAMAAVTAPATPLNPQTDTAAWWWWPLALFVVCFVLGIVAVPAGVGGGVLFVPIVGGFFPFHLDFVRGAGLLVALASALAAGPALLGNGLAHLRLALPLAVLASTSSIGGAMLGLALPAAVINTALGVTILGITVLMALARKSEYPQVPAPDRLSAMLGMHGVFHDAVSGRDVSWQVHRTPLGLLMFTGIGVLAGMFGLGAGWANVPVLNLLMGAPLKVSAGTSSFILSLVDSSAAWVYMNRGAVLAIVAVPSVVGMMLGARIGARLLSVLKASVVRRLVIMLLFVAGLRAILKGLGIWT